MMVGDRMTRPQRRGQDKSQFILTDRVARPILRSRFRSGISETLKTERCLVVMRRLLGVTDIKLDVIGALKRKKILFSRWSRFCFWSSNCRWHNDLLTLSRSARLSKYKIDNRTSQGRGTGILPVR